MNKIEASGSKVSYATLGQPVNRPHELFKNISAKSIGLMFFIISTDANISAKSLAATLQPNRLILCTRTAHSAHILRTRTPRRYQWKQTNGV